MNRSNKRTAVIILGLLTVIVGVIAVIVAIQIQQSQQPPDVSAGTCTGQTSNETGLSQYANFSCAGRENAQPFTIGNDTLMCQAVDVCQSPGVNCVPNLDSCILRLVSTGDTMTCPNTPGTNATSCRIFRCPNGDTNGDGKCETGDTGVTMTNSTSATECNSRNFGGACYQVDYYNNTGAYCGNAIDLNICRVSTTSTPTTSVPARGFCEIVTRTPIEGDGKTDSYPAGTTFNIKARYSQCSSANGNIRLFVFRNTVNAASLVATLTPTNELGVNDNGKCRYDFVWNSQVTIAADYKYRVGRLTNAGEFSVDRLDDENGLCRERVAISVGTTVACGQACGNNGNTCSDGHTCTNNICAADSCLANPGSCAADMCTPVSSTPTSVSTTSSTPGGTIPDTGLFDEDGRPLLVGLILIILGILVNRVNGVTNFLSFAGVGNRSESEQALQSKPRARHDAKFEEKLLKRKRK